MKKISLTLFILFSSFFLIGCGKEKDSEKEVKKEPKQEEKIEKKEVKPNDKIDVNVLVGTWEAIQYSRAGKIYDRKDFDKFDAKIVIKDRDDAILSLTKINGEKKEIKLIFDLEDIRYMFDENNTIYDYIFSLENDILYIYEEDSDPKNIVMDIDCIMLKKIGN